MSVPEDFKTTASPAAADEPEASASDSSGVAASSAPSTGDSLATGVVFVLGLTVFQRLVGFSRSILFCRFLDDDQLGHWSLAFSFLLLAAPLAVLGLTGSFGRYVEYFRVRGHVRTFLRRTGAVAGGLGVLVVVAVCVGRDYFAWFIFHDPQLGRLVLLVAATLCAMIAFNFFLEVMKALRQVRVVSLMELASSLTFAGLGLTLLTTTNLGTSAVVLAYGAGCLIASLGAAVVLARLWRGFDRPAAGLGQLELWGKLAPFAGWLWVTNLLANAFDMADRYMIIHFSGLEPMAAAGLVGQYFSSLVVPTLLVAVVGVLAGVLLPYLSQDWEAGRKREVSATLNLALKLCCLALLTAGTLILLGRDWLFDLALGGKYPQGEIVLPWTVACCSLIAISLMANNFLYCAERARAISFAMLLGLVGNVTLNWLLLPRYGLTGAVVATTLANGLALVVVLWISTRQGMRLDKRLLWLCGLPLLLAIGPQWAPAVLAGVLILMVRGNWIFSERERATVERLADGYLDRAAAILRRKSRQPTV